MNTSPPLSTKVQFFFFGCWNYDNCEGKDFRKGVIDLIRNNLTRYSFGIIAGDNAYARSDKKYYKKTIEYGFDLLRGLDTPLYDAIGNHEIVDDRVYKYQLAQSKQLLTISQDSTSYIAPGNIRIITINTNLFSHKSKHPTKINQDTLLEDLEKKLNQPHSGWTIVVGHEPIFTVKPDKVRSLVKYEKLLQLLSQCDKVMYMCADVHQFQAWNISYNGKIIPMVVVGTGGAKPDDPLDMPYVAEIDNNVATLIASQPAYGYCDVTLAKNKRLEFNYIPLENCGDKHPKPVSMTLNNNTKGLELKDKATVKSSKNPTLCKAPQIEAAVCADTDVLFPPAN